MTANAFVEDVEESRNAGMNEHISKLLDIGKVKATIARYIGHKKMRDNSHRSKPQNEKF